MVVKAIVWGLSGNPLTTGIFFHLDKGLWVPKVFKRLR
jgi:hypothetical protein